MALPTQNWRMLQPVYVGATGNAATGGIAGILDAIYTMGTATTYADGTARTPGSGSAWTWNRDQTTFVPGVTTACYASPPTTTAINQQIIFAGATSVGGGVWKQLYDTRGANQIYGGIGKNTGAYTSWNNATTPFTTGDFTGFAGGMGASNFTSTSTYIVYMLECQESVAVYLQSLSNVNLNCGVYVVGAYLDPLSAAALNAESDGRLYGVTTSGFQGRLASNWLSLTLQQTLFWTDTTSNYSHSVVFTPGAGTVLTCSRFISPAPTTDFVSRNGDLPQIPLQLVAGNNFIGQLRQMFITRDSSSMVAWESGGVVRGYLLGGPLGTSDVLLLTY